MAAMLGQIRDLKQAVVRASIQPQLPAVPAGYDGAVHQLLAASQQREALLQKQIRAQVQVLQENTSEATTVPPQPSVRPLPEVMAMPAQSQVRVPGQEQTSPPAAQQQRVPVDKPAKQKLAPQQTHASRASKTPAEVALPENSTTHFFVRLVHSSEIPFPSLLMVS